MMPNVFDVDAAQKAIAEVGKLMNELTAIDEKRKSIHTQLRQRKAELKQLLAAPGSRTAAADRAGAGPRAVSR